MLRQTNWFATDLLPLPTLPDCLPWQSSWQGGQGAGKHGQTDDTISACISTALTAARLQLVTTGDTDDDSPAGSPGPDIRHVLGAGHEGVAGWGAGGDRTLLPSVSPLLLSESDSRRVRTSRLFLLLADISVGGGPARCHQSDLLPSARSQHLDTSHHDATLVQNLKK